MHVQRIRLNADNVMQGNFSVMTTMLISVSCALVLLLCHAHARTNVELVKLQGTEGAAVNSLFQWATMLGAKFDKLQVQPITYQTPSGNFTTRGVVATEDIEEDEVILSIPLIGMMTRHSIAQSPVHPIRSQHNLTLREEFILFVMYQRIQAKTLTNSFWKPYLDTLELTTLTTIPWQWTDHKGNVCPEKKAEHEKALSEYGSRLSNLALEYQQKTYEKLFPMVLDEYPHAFPGTNPTLVSFRAFQWAYEIMSTRYWFLPVWDDEYQHLMLPIADMFNHADEEDDHFVTGEFNKTSGAWEITSRQTYNKGDEICYYYGHECSEEWSVYYGMDFNTEEPCEGDPAESLRSWLN